VIEVTGEAQRQAWDESVMPPVELVRPGLWSIPVPIPRNPLRYLLAYALEVDGGVALVDAGWNTEEAWSALTGGLEAIGADIEMVRAVLVTHIHPDHYGLAGRVREASGAWVALHPADAAALPDRYHDMDRLIGDMRALLAACGVPDDEGAELTIASMGIRPLVELVQPDVLIEDGARVDLPGVELQAIWTPGHSPGHLCFWEGRRRLLLSGDHVLPRISPNISIHSQQRPDPLADFLESLMKVRGLDAEEVLPAHEWRFRNLAARVDELAAHHADRLVEIEEVVRRDGPATCWEVTTALTWSRPWEDIAPFMRRAANGETLAHLMLLTGVGSLTRSDGIPWRWSPAQAAA